MKTLRKAAQMAAASSLLLVSPTHSQSAASSDGSAAELAAAANAEGACNRVWPLRESDVGNGGRIGPGKYLFYARPDASYDIEMVGAGGSGGGTTMGTGHSHWGAGGAQGEIKRWTAHKLEPGVYLLEVGAGGGAVQGSRDWKDFRSKTVTGQPGGGTAIKRCASGFRVIGANGGAGGAGDSHKISINRASQRAGQGKDLIDIENGVTLGKGGAGGPWQRSGADGAGFGAGGGGQGGYDGTNA